MIVAGIVTPEFTETSRRRSVSRRSQLFHDLVDGEAGRFWRGGNSLKVAVSLEAFALDTSVGIVEHLFSSLSYSYLKNLITKPTDHASSLAARAVFGYDS